MIFRRCNNFFKALILKERDPKILALSFCFGVYVAFSPFVCLHTAMIFVGAWLFSLNFAVAFAATCFFNNPWTMVPIYTTDYFFGNWFLHTLLQIEVSHINPAWMVAVNSFVQRHTGIADISFWAFMIGGNLLGIAISAILYPIIKRLFVRMKRLKDSDESYSEKQKSIS